MLTGLLKISFLGTTVAFDSEARLRRANFQHMLDVVWVQYSIATAQVPAHQLDGESAAKHDLRRFRVAPDVVFSGGSHVAFATRRAAHDHATPDFSCDAGI